MRIVILLALSLPLSAAPRWLYRVSQVAAVSGHTLDAASSWGYQEGNPLMRSRDGRFGRRGLALGLGIRGAWLVGGELIARRRPKLRGFVAVANFGQAGISSVSAARNWRMK